ncbi:MAG: acyl-ACP--UDP-N-acetylglucosamine O-acyltransferase [Planctomycetes bacterium]|nr:acyl-ACP--UDP-N-acetylglucosamine O-acyltransferase [Planctomycetota bacterium]
MAIHATATVHPMALVEPGAEVAAGAVIGPFCHIHAGARVGERTRLLSHVVVGTCTTLGADNLVHPGAVLGGVPQDKTYRGEPTTLSIGNDNVLRECVTINRGTVKGGGKTAVGDRNLLMACSHVGHDCTIGDDIIIANAVLIAGHVHIGDRAVLAGAVACHHFARIGRMAYVGGMSRVVHDVPPFTKVAGERVRVRALNVVGLQRSGIAEAEIDDLKRVYHELFRKQAALAAAVAEVQVTPGTLAAELVQFVREWTGAPGGRYLEQFRTDRPVPAPRAEARD